MALQLTELDAYVYDSKIISGHFTGQPVSKIP